MISNLKDIVTYDVEEDLVSLLKANQRSAFEHLFIMYGGALLGIISETIEPQAEAEKLLTEVFVVLYEMIDDYDPTTGRLFFWMSKITRKLLRKKLKLKKCNDKKQSNTSSDHMINIIDGQVMPNNNFISSLSYDQSVLLQLVYCKGYTYQEVAHFLKCPVATIKSNIKIAMNMIKDIP